MKTLKQLAVFFLAALGITSCSEQDEIIGNRTPVKFDITIGGADSRTSTDEKHVTTWVNGDAIGIIAYKNEKPEIINCKYVFDGTNWNPATETDKILVDEDAVYSYYAYYPYTEGVADAKNIQREVLEDQSANENAYSQSDVLAARSVNELTNEVALDFYHMFCMVEVTVQGTQVTKEPSSVELKGIQPTASLNLVDNSPKSASSVTVSGGTKNIKMYSLGSKQNSDGNLVYAYRAIVPAQIITAGKILAQVNGIDEDGTNKTIKFTSDIPYEKGKLRKLEITISDKVELDVPPTDTNMNPWEDSEGIPGAGGGEDTGDGDGDNEEIGNNIVVPMDATLPLIKNEPDLTAQTEEGWYGMWRNHAPNMSTSKIVEDAEVEKWKRYLQMEYKSIWDSNKGQGSSAVHYGATLCYKHIEPVNPSKLYKLTFKMRMPAVDGTDKEPRLVFKCMGQSNCSFQVSGKPDMSNANKQITMGPSKEELSIWKEYTCYVDFSKKDNGGNTDSNDYDSMTLRFYTANNIVATESQEFLIRADICDVTLAPVEE